MNYQKLTKVQLLDLIAQRDKQIQELLNKGGQQDEGTLTATDIIDAILLLSDAEKKQLPVLIRTDNDGMKAYGCFLHGAIFPSQGTTATTPDIAKPNS